MKKSILIMAMLSVFMLGSIKGQMAITNSLTPVQATSCVGSTIALTYKYTTLSTVTVSGCFKIKCNGVDIGSSASFTNLVIYPGSTVTAVLPIIGTLPVVSDGSYIIFVYFSSLCTSTVNTGIFPAPPYQIYLLNAPNPTISVVGSTSICLLASVSLSTSAIGTYSWSNGATTQSISVNAPANYTVKVTNQCCIPAGSWVVSNPVTITQIPNPTISISVVGSNTVCSGQSVVLNSSASSNTNITWSNAQVGNSITVTSAAIYSAVATNTCGNTANSNTVSVTVNPNPTVSISTTNTLLCVGQSATLSALGANSYSWNIGPNTSTISVSPVVNTIYTVTGTNSITSCSANKTFTQMVTTCVGIFENSSIKSLISKVYPIPSSDNITIELANVNDNSKVLINMFSVDGKKVLSSETELIDNRINLSVSDLKSGIYILEIVSGGSKSTSRIAVSK